MSDWREKFKAWLAIPRNRTRATIGLVSVAGVVIALFLIPQLDNLVNLSGSKASIAWPSSWGKTVQLPPVGSGYARERVALVAATQPDANKKYWLYALGGISNNGSGMPLADVFRLELDADGKVMTSSAWLWPGNGGVPAMKFGHVEPRTVIHGDYLYVIAGDAHVMPANPGISTAGIYSTIERLNLTDPSVGWEIYAVLSGVNFYPEVAVFNDKLQIVGGVYGFVNGLVSPAAANTRAAADKAVLTAAGVALGRTIQTVPITPYNNIPIGFDAAAFSTELTAGRIVTTVGTHIQLTLDKAKGQPFVVADYQTFDLGHDYTGADLMRFFPDNPHGLLVSNASPHIPLVQGRVGHKLVVNQKSLWVIGGMTWSPQTTHSIFGSPITTVSRAWVITDSAYPIPTTGDPDGSQCRIYASGGSSDYRFMGNTVYRWNGSAAWVGTNPDTNGGTTLDPKYKLEVKDYTQGALTNTSGLASFGLSPFMLTGDPRSLITAGGVSNAQPGWHYQSITANFETSYYCYIPIKSRVESFSLSGTSSWQPEANIPTPPTGEAGAGVFSLDSFGIQNYILGLNSHQLASGTSSSVRSADVLGAAPPYSFPSYPPGDVPPSLGVSLVGSANEANSALGWSYPIAVGAKVGSSVAVAGDYFYKIGVAIGSGASSATEVEVLGPIDLGIKPDATKSSLTILPTTIGDDGYAYANAVFQLKNKSGEPLAGVNVGINSSKNADIVICPANPYSGGAGAQASCKAPGAVDALTAVTNADGIAALGVRSKDLMNNGDSYPISMNLTGYWWVDQLDGSKDSPTGSFSPAPFSLAAQHIPFNLNSSTCFLEAQTNNCLTETAIQLLANGTARVRVQATLKDNSQGGYGPRILEPTDGYLIQLVSDRNLAGQAAADAIIPEQSYDKDGQVSFLVSSPTPGQAKLTARYQYKPDGTPLLDPLIEAYRPWVPLIDRDLTITFTGQAGTITPAQTTQGDGPLELTLTGVGTNWSSGNTTVSITPPPVITFAKSGGGDISTLDLRVGGAVVDLQVSAGSNYTDQVIALSINTGKGSLIDNAGASVNTLALTTDNTGKATFKYRPGGDATDWGIDKILARLATGTARELLLPIKQNPPATNYKIEILVDPSVLGAKTRVIRARATYALTNQPIAESDIAFGVGNNGGGSLGAETANTNSLGIAQIAYFGDTTGVNGKIIISVNYHNEFVFTQLTVDNSVATPPGNITKGAVTVASPTQIKIADVRIPDNAMVGGWAVKVDTTYGAGADQFHEIQNYLFTVKARAASLVPYITKVSPAASERDRAGVQLLITGVDVNFSGPSAQNIAATLTHSYDNTKILTASAVNNLTDSTGKTMTATFDFPASALPGYYNFKATWPVAGGGTVTVSMPGSFDFLIRPNDVASGYFINFTASPTSLPADNTATSVLTAVLGKLNTWTGTIAYQSGKTMNFAIVSGGGSFTTAATRTTDTNGRATATYKVNDVAGPVSLSAQSTIIDSALAGGSIALAATLTLQKLVLTHDLTFRVDANPATIDLRGVSRTSTLVVTLQRADGTGIGTRPITLALTGLGRLAQPTITTGSNGKATTTYFVDGDNPPEGVSTVDAETVVVGIGPISTVTSHTGATITRSRTVGAQVTLNLVVPLQGNKYNYAEQAVVKVIVMAASGVAMPEINNTYKLDSTNKVIGLPMFYASLGATYSVWVDPPNHLAVGASFTAPATNQTVTPTLKSSDNSPTAYAGDIGTTRDDQVGLYDFQIFTSQFMTSLLKPLADLNGDGAVNVHDFGILTGNWFKTGMPKFAGMP
ncbi:MAG: hypothetical protein V1826_02640 [bacterium]